MTFQDLSQKDKEKLIEKWRYVLVEDPFIEEDWYEPIFDEFEAQMREFGIENVEIKFSGFYSQGDGASFTGDVTDNFLFFQKNWEKIGKKQQNWLDLDEIKTRIDPDFDFLVQTGVTGKERFKIPIGDLVISIQRTSSGNHFHEFTISSHVEWYEEVWPEEEPSKENVNRVNRGIENLEQQITDWAREKSRILYRELEKYYEKITSEEAVVEWLEENFTPDFLYNIDSSSTEL
jgi:hypothetical protein